MLCAKCNEQMIRTDSGSWKCEACGLSVTFGYHVARGSLFSAELTDPETSRKDVEDIIKLNMRIPFRHRNYDPLSAFRAAIDDLDMTGLEE